MPSSQDEQLAGRAPQHAAVVPGDVHHVLDPDAAEPRQVDTRLDRDDGAVGQGLLLGGVPAQERDLVDLEPEPVAEAVREALAQAGGLDDAARGAVVTVEPGIYVPGLGGVRIEDMVEVTEDGGRVVGTSTRDLIEL